MGRGSGIRVRGNGIQISFYWHGQRFQKTLKLEPTKANLKYAERLRGTILLEIAQQTFDPSKYFKSIPENRIPTFREAMETWLGHMEKSTATSTLRDYRSCSKYHLIPFFGELPLDKVTTTEIRRFISTLQCSNKRINNILTPLRGVLGDAFQDGVIEKNPMDRIRSLSIDTSEPEPFSLEEIRKILDACEGPLQNLIQFSFWSGLRTSELIGLEWGDIDWGRNVICVRRAFIRGHVKETKTKAGKREVKILDQARKALEAQKEHSLLSGGRIFTNPLTRQPWSGDNKINHHWASVLRKAGVAYRNPYQTRHTYASLLLSAGENPMWVAQQMGHADWGMIRKRYGRWIPSIDPAVGNRANEIGSQFGSKNASFGDKTVTEENG